MFDSLFELKDIKLKIFCGKIQRLTERSAIGYPVGPKAKYLRKESNLPEAPA